MTIQPGIIKLRQRWHGYEGVASEIIFIGIVFIWGITFVLTRDAVQVIGPFAYNTSRMMLGGLTMAILAGSQWKMVNRIYLWPAFVVGTVLFLSYALQTYGQQFTTASKAGFLTGTNLVYVPVFSALLLRRMPGRLAILGVVLAFAGLVLVSIEGNLIDLALAQGDIFVILSGVGWALYIIVMARYAPQFNVMLFATLHVLVAAVMCGLCWLVSEPLYLPLDSKPVWLGVLVTGFCILGLGTTIQGWVMRWASPTHVGLIAALEPLFAGLAGWWVGETITQRVLLGGGLIILGVLASELGERLKPRSNC
jgi:drug/metabolite transporter (DMT)-like permease